MSNSSSSSSSSSPPLPHTFYPPFYGRPPTPLPPSPSLTSLLRPSHPTTPEDSSDIDESLHPRRKGVITGTGATAGRGAVTTGIGGRPPIVPTYEYYGFVLYLFSSLTFLIYLLWSYLPSPFLHALGIYYYPNRWWSLALPSFLVMFLLYIYVALAAYNTSYLTLPLQSIETIVDESANVAATSLDHLGAPISTTAAASSTSRRKEKSLREWRDIWDYATDAVMDVPLGGVCEILYGDLREDRESH